MQHMHIHIPIPIPIPLFGPDSRNADKTVRETKFKVDDRETLLG